MVFSAIVLIGLLGAGVWYVSESLVQMSLYRFSIYPKVLGSIASASLLLGSRGLVPKAVSTLILSASTSSW